MNVPDPSGSPRLRMIGFLRGLTIYNILKALEQEEKSAMVEVERGAHRGVVFVEKGRVIHAHTDHQEGEDAVKTLLGWGEVTATLYELPLRVPTTVRKSVEELFIEALTEQDEERKIEGEPEVVEVERAARAVEALWKNWETGGAGMAANFEKILEGLAELTGFEGAAVISEEGLLMASRFSVDADEEKFAAFVQEAVQMAQNLIDSMEWGTLDNMVIESEDKHKLVLYRTKFGYVALFGNKALNLGMARIRVDEAAEELEEEL